jgi:molecular chaperone DnaK (HSP70)
MAAEEATTNGTTAGERHVIGISIGNSNSSIAYTTTDDKAEVIANEEGGEGVLTCCIWLFANSPLDRQIPSILSYVNGEEFVGTQAKAQLVRNSKNTVAYFRDFIGQE